MEEEEQSEIQPQDPELDQGIVRTPEARPTIRISPPTSSLRALYPRDVASQLNSSQNSCASSRSPAYTVHPSQSEQLPTIREVEEPEASARILGHVIPDSQSIPETPDTPKEDQSSVETREFGIPNTAPKTPSINIGTHQNSEISPVPGTLPQDNFTSKDPDQAFLQDDSSETRVLETIVLRSSASSEPEARLQTGILVAIGEQSNIEKSQESQIRPSQAITLSEIDPNTDSTNADRDTGKWVSSANPRLSAERLTKTASPSVIDSQPSKSVSAQSQTAHADPSIDKNTLGPTESKNTRLPQQSTTLTLAEALAQISSFDGTMPTPPPRPSTPSSSTSRSTSVSRLSTQPRERRKDPGRFKDNIAGLFKARSSTPSSAKSSITSAQPPQKRLPLPARNNDMLSSDWPSASQTNVTESAFQPAEAATQSGHAKLLESRNRDHPLPTSLDRPPSQTDLMASQVDQVGVAGASDSTGPLPTSLHSTPAQRIPTQRTSAQPRSHIQTPATQPNHANIASSNDLNHLLPTSLPIGVDLPRSQPATIAPARDSIVALSNDFCGLLPMDKDTKILYQDILAYFQKTKAIENDVLRQLLGVCCHPDILDELPVTQAMGANTQDDWAVSRSQKFAFLKSFIAHIHLTGKHVVIYANSTGRLMDLTEGFIRGLQIPYVRCDTGAARVSKDVAASRVTLISTDHKPPEVTIRPADIVLGLDSTFDVDMSQVRNVRHGRDGTLCPSITLIIANSIEHILQKYRNEQPDRIPSTEILLSMATRCSSVVGDTSMEVHTADLLGKKVAQSMTSEAGSSWAQLPKLLDLPDLTASSTSVVTGAKRKTSPQDLTIAEVQRKRQRKMSPSHAQSQKDLAPPGQASQHIAVSETGDIAIQNQPTGTTTMPEDNTLALQALQLELENVKTDRDKLAMLTKEQEVTASNVQSRYEAQDQALADATKQINQLRGTVASQGARIESQGSTIADLRSERSTLQDELRAERLKSVEGLYGPVAQATEELRIKVDRTDSLERKIANLEKQTDYFRSEYQSARGEASSRGSENDVLREELDEYKRKASIEVRKLAQMRNIQKIKVASSAVERAQAEARQYKLEVERLAKATKDLKEELEHEKKRRGMGGATRSSSLPPGRALPVPGPAVLAAAGLLSGAKGRKAGISSASASRAVSPMPGIAPSAKTSPLQRTMAISE